MQEQQLVQHLYIHSFQHLGQRSLRSECACRHRLHACLYHRARHQTVQDDRCAEAAGLPVRQNCCPATGSAGDCCNWNIAATMNCYRRAHARHARNCMPASCICQMSRCPRDDALQRPVRAHLQTHRTRIHAGRGTPCTRVNAGDQGTSVRSQQARVGREMATRGTQSARARCAEKCGDLGRFAPWDVVTCKARLGNNCQPPSSGTTVSCAAFWRLL